MPAFEWFMRGDRTWAFSFLNVCDSLELDPAAVRQVMGLPASGPL